MKIVYVTLFLLGSITVSFSQTYILKSYVIDDGGAAKATSSGYIMGGSISQSFIGKLTSSGYTAYVGYWTPGNTSPGIEERENAQSLGIPVVFSFKQNYPNPITSRTIIKYSLPKTCQVELKLFDVTGREIAILVNENQRPGYYQVTWEIRNSSQKQLPNGVYFYQLKADDFIETRKMIILR